MSACHLQVSLVYTIVYQFSISLCIGATVWGVDKHTDSHMATTSISTKRFGKSLHADRQRTIYILRIICQIYGLGSKIFETPYYLAIIDNAMLLFVVI